MRILSCFAVSVLLCSSVYGAEDDPKAIEFFEKKIRPVLEQSCYSCHSAEAEAKKKLRGGLLLDSRDAVLTGGDSGPSIVPGKIAESLLLKTIKYDGETRMPPKGKLPESVIKDFETWIATGAVDPRLAKVATKKQVGLSLEEGRKFWSYKPVVAPAIPATKDANWAINDVDRFILEKIEAAKLTPTKDAPKAILIRRLYYTLIGLPPTPEQVDAFVKDTSENAYEKLVEQLLASPQFGERWGRHWLDVARFGESLTLRGFIFKEAWRYRDYVFDSINADIPFSQFIREQLAGDLLPSKNLEESRRNLVATSFLTLGNTNLEEQDKKQLRMDVVDEQLDVITKGFLGQTVTCARCHDHKFDPIPTKDYYALAGILRNAKAMEHSNVSKWIEMPLPVDPTTEATIKKHEALVANLQARIKTEKAKQAQKPSSNTKKILTAKEIVGVVVDDVDAKKVGEWQASTHSGFYIGSGYIHDQGAGKGDKTLSFEPQLPHTGKYEVRLAYSPGAGRADNVPVTVFGADGEKTIPVNMQQNPTIDGRFISLGEYKFEKTGQTFVIVANEGTKGIVSADAVVFIPVDGKIEQGNVVSATNSHLKDLESELKRLQESGPKREMAMTVVEEKQIEDAKIHIRGSVNNLGEVAARGFLQVVSVGKTPKIPAKESGRKELAEWIASPENPLTSRVMVNRIWHWVFGVGIVRTVDNFGTTGELPSHPALLEYLASRFNQEHGSIKSMVRLMVLSRTYRQDSVSANALIAADPENRLFARANRQRMDAEQVRDTMLFVSGQLQPSQDGANFPESLQADYNYKSNSNRRSVYLPVFRNSLPELFEVFDFADASMVTGRRNASTIAPQALFFMNNPFPREQAQHATERLLKETANTTTLTPRIDRAYRLTLGRTASTKEIEIATQFIDRSSDAKEAWTILFQSLFASADFRMIN
jgi:hypothetical protein